MKDRILGIISEVTKIDRQELVLHMDEEKIWDSLKHIELIIRLESEFDKIFNEDELADMTTVSKIMDKLKEDAQ